MIVDYYQILGISYEASVSEIRAAYRRTAKRCHPDMGGSHQQMVEVIEAWEVLSDPAVRAVYDTARNSQAAAAQASWQTARERTTQTASAVAADLGQSWEQFVAWVEKVAANSDAKRASRGLAGAVSGSIIAGIIGLVIGRWVGLDAVSGAVAGLTAGAIGGFFAGRSRGAASKST